MSCLERNKLNDIPDFKGDRISGKLADCFLEIVVDTPMPRDGCRARAAREI